MERRHRKARVKRRLEGLSAPSPDMALPDSTGTRLDRALAWAGRFLSAERRERLARRLAAAHCPLSPQTFFGLGLAGGAAGLILGLWAGRWVGSRAGVFGLLLGGLTGSLLGLAGGLALPQGLLAWSRFRHGREMKRSFILFTDLLRIGARAGLSWRTGVARAVDRMEGPFAEALERYLLELRLGRPSESALAALSQRIDLRDFEELLARVALAEELGLSLFWALEPRSPWPPSIPVPPSPPAEEKTASANGEGQENPREQPDWPEPGF